MTEPIVLDGLPGVVHAASSRNTWTVRLYQKGQHVDMGCTVGSGLRLLEFDGVFYVGTTEVRLISIEPRRWTTLLHSIATFDNLDAALACFYTECGV